MELVRVCRVCDQAKEIKAFSIINRKYIRKDGTKSITRRKVCNKCMNDKYTKDYLERNKEHVYQNMSYYRNFQKLANTDVYIKSQLRHNFGIKSAAVTQEMLNIKRKINEISRKIG